MIFQFNIPLYARNPNSKLWASTVNIYEVYPIPNQVTLGVVVFVGSMSLESINIFM